MKKALLDFLTQKSKYNPDKILEKIGEETWLIDEYIEVLLKAQKAEKAIETYVRKGEWNKAKDFCVKNKLLTQLLTIYLEHYKEKPNSQQQRSFKQRAIDLMKSKEARS